MNKRLDAQRQAARRERMTALAYVHGLAQQGRGSEALKWTLDSLYGRPPVGAAHPALRKLRLWQWDAMVNDVSQRRAENLVAKAMGLCDDWQGKPGWQTFGVCVDRQEHSERLTAWLWLMARRSGLVKFRPPEGYPLSVLFGKETYAG